MSYYLVKNPAWIDCDDNTKVIELTLDELNIIDFVLFKEKDNDPTKKKIIEPILDKIRKVAH